MEQWFYINASPILKRLGRNMTFQILDFLDLTFENVIEYEKVRF